MIGVHARLAITYKDTHTYLYKINNVIIHSMLSKRRILFIVCYMYAILKKKNLPYKTKIL